MVTLRKRGQIQETPANNTKKMSKTNEEISGYEQCRDQRIKQNMERMQKLGILDLSHKLKSDLLPPKRSPRNLSERKTPQRSSPLPSSEPPRRSSRLQNVNPVSYVELRPKRGKQSEEEDGKDLIKEGVQPEIYTEEHEKLLGTCEAPWDLFKDGYGTDGKRIYDPVKGKTCHQCRSKTLGHRTHCSKCNMVQGQFCGDCLYTRYGENVKEANQKPSWICPVCRGICNCSLCRLAKGWVPTGYMYRKIEKLGFKSVAHYLIQTRRSQTNLEENQGTEDPVSAKRSLPFADSEESSQQNETLNSDENTKLLSEDNANTDELSQQKETFHSDENSMPLSEDIKDNDQLKGEKAEPRVLVIDLEEPNVTLETKSKLIENPSLAMGPRPDSIAGRLRLRRARS
ncbi:Zinc-finger domain of monoamine-oxidase A repressor R1 [Macleaya cordata]|uniref:Zinc-finger domain of monoamine-oxidase A repressor R1 n=1 Tax=Macleaya cordata TaxID=56857 RepID=A0A200QJF9_MACCD|nr:Zinc-finger domain of monoamine-oxidase A repressor R1 [Macleaya cordata]